MINFARSFRNYRRCFRGVSPNSKMSANVVDEYSDELNEGPRRIRTGCTIGRVINLCIALNFLLVMITALIVSGTLGAVNLAVSG